MNIIFHKKNDHFFLLKRIKMYIKKSAPITMCFDPITKKLIRINKVHTKSVIAPSQNPDGGFLLKVISILCRKSNLIKGFCYKDLFLKIHPIIL